jgi:fructose-1,6-bisphosphatase/inositol monophosphatase family enzyme
VYDQLQRRCRVTRTWGDGYGYLLVATGRADVMVDPAMDLWDAAALLPVIQEAGGHFSDWEGRVTVHSKDSLACPPQLVEAVLAITRGECTVA